MKRPARIAFNILAPPLAATLVFAIPLTASAAANSSNMHHLIDAICAILAVSHVVALLPSAIHALAMERVYKRFVPRSWASVGISGLSGIFAGILISAFFFLTNARTQIDSWFLMFPALGLIVGFVVGLLVKLFSRTAIPDGTHTMRGCE